MNKALLVVAALVIFVLGGGAGVFYQSQADAPQLQSVAKAEALIKNVSSGIIPSMVAYGQVSKVEGRNVTLSYAGDSLAISVKQDAPVYSFAQAAGSTTPTQQKVDFSTIKVGNNLNIVLKMLASGDLEGQQVIILPSATAK